MKTQLRTLPILLLTAMIWGFAFVAQVDGIQYIGSFTMNGVRYVLGALALLPVMLFFERGKSTGEERRKTFVASLVAGTVLFLACTLQQVGIEYTGSAGISGFITGLYTVLVPVGCFLVFRQRTGWNVWLGSACSVLGLFLLCYRPEEGLSFGIGELLLFLCALFFASVLLPATRVARAMTVAKRMERAAPQAFI